MPRGHRGPAHAARHRAVEIAVGRQRSRGRRAELEHPEGEVPRARREERRGQTVAVPALGVAADAPRVIDLAPQGQEIRAAWDVHVRDPDRLRLEHFAPGATIGPELLDVADQTVLLPGGKAQVDLLDGGWPFAETVEVAVVRV